MPSSSGPVRAGRGRLPLDQYVKGVLAGDRVVLARAITLIESRLPSDADKSARLLDAILPHTGQSRRIGITGVPGVGKSTFIDALGMHVIRDRGERLAVLTVDPSSPISGGSILGDKTRMERLARHPSAFIRPSPSGGEIGGVARRTRETITLCEAAGFEIVLVETVGVGQSEVLVREMVDCFLLLLIAGAGDELQGIKKGITEMADIVAVNKADGENRLRVDATRLEFERALHYFTLSDDSWHPPVLACSALAREGVREVWAQVVKFMEHGARTGEFLERRRSQSLAWLSALLEQGLREAFAAKPDVMALKRSLEVEVAAGTASAPHAARQLLRAAGLITPADGPC